MEHTGRNAREISIPKIEPTELGGCARNVGYEAGAITCCFETKTIIYIRRIRLLVGVMGVEEARVLDCFVEAGSELRCAQIASVAEAFCFFEIGLHEVVSVGEEDLSAAEAGDILAPLYMVTNEMDELEVMTGSHIPFIAPTLRGVVDDFGLANPSRSNRVFTRSSRVDWGVSFALLHIDYPEMRQR